MASFWTSENPGFQGFETWKLGFSKSRMDNNTFKKTELGGARK
jgi:hypothetical protein